MTRNKIHVQTNRLGRMFILSNPFGSVNETETETDPNFAVGVLVALVIDLVYPVVHVVSAAGFVV